MSAWRRRESRDHLVLASANLLQLLAGEKLVVPTPVPRPETGLGPVGELELCRELRPRVRVPAVLRALEPELQLPAGVRPKPAEHAPFGAAVAGGLAPRGEVVPEDAVDVRRLHDSTLSRRRLRSTLPWIAPTRAPAVPHTP